MTSLIITDGLLCLGAAAAVANSRLPLAFRMGSALLGVTAGLGVLRFSDLLPLPTLHGFFSAFSASSAFLLMAVSTIWASSAGATRAKYASILLIVSGAAGFDSLQACDAIAETLRTVGGPRRATPLLQRCV